MTNALEDVKTIDVEEWLTLNTSASPTKLKLGETPNAQNVWVDEQPGSVVTANGYLKVGTLPSGNPPSFCLNYFKTSTGSEIFVVSDNATVWTTLDFQTFTSKITGLSSSFQLRGCVVRNKLWLTNGSDSVRTFDGTTVAILDGTASTPNVPKGRYIAYHDERVWMYHTSSERSGLYFSALTDTSGAIIAPDTANAWPSSNMIQVSEGDGDFGTGLLLYRGYLYAFKQYSIYRVIGYDEYTYTRVKTRSATGTRFNESIQVLDTAVHFIGTDGIYVFDGEDSDRISDIISPLSAAQTAFGFSQLQQPNTNNFFWSTGETAEWALGTVPANITNDDSLTFKAADTSAADFAAGNTLTNISTADNPGSIQLKPSASGISATNMALNKTGFVNPNPGNNVIGAASFLTDGNMTNAVGMNGSGNHNLGSLGVSGLLPGVNYTTVVLKNATFNYTWLLGFQNESGYLTPVSVSVPAGVSGSVTTATVNGIPPGTTIVVIGTSGVAPGDVTITFNAFTATTLTLVYGGTSNNYAPTMTELQVFTAAYNATGQFISKSLDLGAAPASLGNFNADATVPAGTTATYYTQSSADNAAWDAAVVVTNGGAVGSTARRYLRWRVDFTSTGAETPVIAAAYLMAQYISVVHNTGGSIFAWGPFEAQDTARAGQTVNFYYRAATTEVGVASASWNKIEPGGVISEGVTKQYIQFKIEILGGTGTQLPEVPSVTINWVVGTGTQPQTLQNVASIVWKNRYWLAAAGAGATANNTVIIRGKKTFKAPWQLKDWSLLSFSKFHDGLYGGSSVDGSIYRLDTGFSKNGAALDSFFETGDILFGGFEATVYEVLLEVERLGPYNLSVGVSIDQGATWTEKTVDLTVSTFASNYIKRLNFDQAGTRFRFRVRTNAADKPFQVHRMMCFYKQSQKRGSLH